MNLAQRKGVIERDQGGVLLFHASSCQTILELLKDGVSWNCFPALLRDTNAALVRCRIRVCLRRSDLINEDEIIGMSRAG